MNEPQVLLREMFKYKDPKVDTCEISSFGA
jgi:hypothetical protein